MTQRTWTCNGEPKDGKQYPNCSGFHEPYENYGPDCVVCGLPKEAMTLQNRPKPPPKTVTSSNFSLPLPTVILVGVLLALAAGLGFYKVYEARQGSDEPVVVTADGVESPDTAMTPADSQAIASANAANAQLISQGEKILLTSSTNLQKNAGAAAFAQNNWDEALAQYQQAATTDPNDPETKIYLNNAKAKKAGNPLTMAVGVPITPNANAAKEVLRGVALAQDQLNQSPRLPGRLLEVVIVNEEQPAASASLAQDLIAYPNVLGVLGQGVGNDSRQAIALYQQAGLTVLSPISTSITSGGSQSTLKTIPLAQKANELAETYLQSVSKTLAQYANKQQSPAAVAVFYNLDSQYSKNLKDRFIAALTQVKGKVVKEVDITTPGFNAAAEITAANQAGAKIAFLALSKDKVEQAVGLVKANKSIKLIGSDDLYTPTVLTKGGDAIKGIVLAVPWSSQPNDPFAQQAASIWRGRVSWRTATAYDATLALASVLTQNPSRTGVTQLFNQGIPVPSGTATNFDVLNEVPLVQAVKGSNGPPGSDYQFDPI